MSATLITGSGQPGLLLGGSVRRLSPDPPATSAKLREFLWISSRPLWIPLTLGIMAYSQGCGCGKAGWLWEGQGPLP